MAAEHFKMWHQGKYEFEPLKCDDMPQFPCPESKTIAAEYMRGFYTLTNVINPNNYYDNLGIESWQYQLLENVKVNDVIWLALVPPKHHVLSAFGYNQMTLIEHSSLSSMAGITLTLVTGEFEEEDANGNCEMKNSEDRGTLAFPTGKDPEEQFTFEASINKTLDTKTWLGVGLRVDALPNNKKLSDIVGAIVVGVHAIECAGQIYM